MALQVRINLLAAALMCVVARCAVGGAPTDGLTLGPLDRIKPGTVIADRAPPGWSQLIIKSVPKVTSGDLDKVPESTVKLASQFFNAILVKTSGHHSASGKRRFELRGLAIGLGTSVDGKDTILSYSDPSYKQLGAGLGFIAGKVLSKSEEYLSETVVVTYSSTMAIFDSPCNWVRSGKHVPAVVRYACMVDPRDGRIFTLAWLLDKTDSGYRLAEPSMVLLPPNLVADCPMHVDASKFFLGIPAADAFAVTRLPPGTRLPMPEAARTLAADGSFAPATSTHRLEVSLWAAIFPPAPVQPATALGPRP